LIEESSEVRAIFVDLRGHRGGVEIGGAPVRESMAGDFVTIMVKPDNVIGAEPGPVAGPLIHQLTGDIERAARIVLIENSGAGGGGTFGNVVEGEADHRAVASQPVRRGGPIPGQPVADARL
jgi:hypothetical protein